MLKNLIRSCLRKAWCFTRRIFYHFKLKILYIRINDRSISFFRWIIIFFPNKSERIFTRRKSKMMIAVCWLIPLLFLLPSMTGVYGEHGLECLSRSCTILKDENGHSTKNFLFAFGFGLPTLVLLLTNTSIYIKIKVSCSNLLFQIWTSYFNLNF